MDVYLIKEFPTVWNRSHLATRIHGPNTDQRIGSTIFGYLTVSLTHPYVV